MTTTAKPFSNKPVANAPAAAALPILERVDVSHQCVIELQGPSFVSRTLVKKNEHKMLELVRRNGGEVWPMHGKETLEFSAHCATAAEQAVALMKNL